MVPASVLLDVSSFSDYAALGRAYAARAWPRSPPRPGGASAGGPADRGRGRQARTSPCASTNMWRRRSATSRPSSATAGSCRAMRRPCWPRDGATARTIRPCCRRCWRPRASRREPALISLRNRYTLPDAPGLGALGPRDHLRAVARPIPRQHGALRARSACCRRASTTSRWCWRDPSDGAPGAHAGHAAGRAGADHAHQGPHRRRRRDQRARRRPSRRVRKGSRCARWRRGSRGAGRPIRRATSSSSSGHPGTGSFSFASPEEIGGGLPDRGTVRAGRSAGRWGRPSRFSCRAGSACSAGPASCCSTRLRPRMAGTPAILAAKSRRSSSNCRPVRRVQQLPHDVDEQWAARAIRRDTRSKMASIRVRREFSVETPHEFCAQCGVCADAGGAGRGAARPASQGHAGPVGPEPGRARELARRRRQVTIWRAKASM